MNQSKDSDDDNDNDNSRSKKKNKCSELSLYLAEALPFVLCDTNSKEYKMIDKNPMQYWFTDTKYTKLFFIADYVYCSNVHQCQSERNFKKAKKIFNVNRSTMSPDHGEYQAMLGDCYRRRKLVIPHDQSEKKE